MAQRTSPANLAKQNNPTKNPAQLTFLEHFYELRKRFFWIALTLVITTIVGLEIKDQLIATIVAPLRGAKLVYLTPGGGFSFIFTLSLYFGVLLTIPVITYHLYCFLRPMIKNTSRRFIFLFISASVILAALGAALAYFLAIPSALGFLNDFTGNSIVPNLTADSYLKFVVTYTVGLAALFQLPLLLFLVDHIRPFPPGTLLRTQRYGIVAATILAGLITPSPDLINYAIVLFPILGVYEFGVFIVFMRRRLSRAKTAQASPPEQIASKPVEEEKPQPQLQPQPEPVVVREEPLTSVIEELAKEDKQDKEDPQPEPQRTTQTAIPARRRSVIGRMAFQESITEPAVELAVATVQAPVKPEPQPVKPRRTSTGRNIDGFYKADHRGANTQSVHAATQTPANTKDRQPVQKKSIDGFLTARA